MIRHRAREISRSRNNNTESIHWGNLSQETLNEATGLTTAPKLFQFIEKTLPGEILDRHQSYQNQPGQVFPTAAEDQSVNSQRKHPERTGAAW